MPTTNPPQLAAPGAGLPSAERLIAGKGFALKCRMGNTKSFLVGFRAEQSKIQELVKSCPPEKRQTQVLIPRLRGMEDSSRYWSVWMTLEHLRIVNSGISAFIIDLTEGRIPEGELSTADVKPDPEVTESVEASFEAGCQGFLLDVSNAGDLKTAESYPHPWFGPLDAYRWLGLASMHMGIHRGQIEAIVHDLNS